MNAIVKTNAFTKLNPIKSGFRIEQTDRLTIQNKHFDWAGQSGDTIFLQPSNGQGMTEQFTMGMLSRLSAAGEIKHEVGFYLPDDLKPAPLAKGVSFQVSDLNVKQKTRFYGRYAQIMAIEDMVSEGLILPCKKDINASLKEIETRAVAYLKKEATERDLLDHALEHQQLPEAVAKSVRKKRGGGSKDGIALYSGDYLRKLYKNYQKYGLSAVADTLSKSGNRHSGIRPAEQSLLMKTIRTSYMTLERKTLKATVVDVQRAFRHENKRLVEEGELPLRVPGRGAVRGAIKKIEPLRIMIARHGREYAIKKLRPVGKGLEVSRPGERVEMDEWCIDLQSIIHSANLREFFGDELLDLIGLNGDTARWWLVLAIDCRTKVILGMKLTRNPCASAAQECLRMVVSDKGAWADASGALTPWSMAVKPELMVTDNGPAFKSGAFTHCCLDMRIPTLRTHAGVPGMRGIGERIFGTLSTDLMPRLVGRTFSNSIERGDYKSELRACLDAEDVAFILVRWVVDIYHNSPHSSLGGRTPLEQWDADMEDGNYPLSGLPDVATKRLAFGKRIECTVSQQGIVVMGVRYHSPELGMYFMGLGSKRVDVRWDPENLGAVSVYLEGAWQVVPSVHDRFVGMHFHDWMKVRRALRAKSASRKIWNQEIVFNAIDQIEDLVKDRSMAFGIIDTTISDEQFSKIQADLFSSFRMDDTPRLKADGNGLGRAITPRAPDPDIAPSGSKAPAKAGSVKPSPDVEKRAKATSPADTLHKRRAAAPKFGLPPKHED
ncbi:putative transposase [Sulfitobacter brevis]|uniref:Putative transposase n=1 Tax=Sulfitobacter brevis TaxID=74348 RepID=A0A1I2GWY1_9RHOB|nr:Mu transposase C-terminal domain-containing protein [Sulfitobacter brevis]SFF21277.1 putative transposase [Sulfitobacter brevis]